MSAPNPAEPFTGLPDYPAIAELRRRAQWVAWKYEFRNGPDAKPTKPPVSPRSGFPASHSNPATWATYEEARDCAIRRGLPGVGYVLTEDDGICGIDLDNCRDPETGALDEWALEIVNLCETYTEASPSGRGVRLFALGKPGKATKRGNIEIYGSKRYLTVTGNHLGNTPLDIKPAPWTLAALEARVAAMEPARAESAPVDGPARMAAYPAGTADAELRELLRHIDADYSYPVWLAILMGIHHGTNGAGKALAIDWSSRGSKFKNALEIDRKWRGFKVDGGVTVNTIAYYARLGGADLYAISIKYNRPEGYDAAEGKAAADRLRERIEAKAEQAGKAEYEPRYSENEDGDVIDNETGEVVTPPAPAVTEPTGEAIYPPGLVGSLAKYILATARVPQPEFAIAAALVIVGTVAGRQYIGPTKSGTHLYALILGNTGSGKDHPQSQIRRILTAAGYERYIGLSEFISMPSVINFLVRLPLSVCVMDEYGSFNKRINSKKASGFESAIAKILRQMWSTSFDTYITPEWAQKERVAIHTPAMSIFGASTPEQFYQSMQGGEIEDGTLNRYLLVNGRSDAEEVEAGYDAAKVPEDLARDLQWIFLRSGGAKHVGVDIHEAHADPVALKRVLQVSWAGDGARERYSEFRKKIEKRSKSAKTSEAERGLLARVTEMGVRIATIIAIGRMEGDDQVTLADLNYGFDMALRSTELMIGGADEHMSENEHHANVKFVLGIIRRKRRISRSDLLRLAYRIRSRDLTEIIETLKQAGSIRVIGEPTKGMTGTHYVWMG